VSSVQTWTRILVNETNCTALLISFLERTQCSAACCVVPVTFHLAGVMKDHTTLRHIAIEKWEVIILQHISINQPVQINIRCTADVENERQKSVCSFLLQKSNCTACLIMFTFMMCETRWIWKNSGVLNFKMWLYFTCTINQLYYFNIWHGLHITSLFVNIQLNI
jgi:hypothetical protein